MKAFIPVSVLAVTLLGATSALAAVPVGATLKVGTQGVGADVTAGINAKFNARVNLNYFSFNIPASEDDNKDNNENNNGNNDGNKNEDGGGSISPKLGLMTIGALLDWHPWAQGFRLSAGLYLNKNKIDLTADVGDTVEINDREYSLSDLRGRVDFNTLAPYLGLGYGNAVGSNGRWHFSCDVGVMFQGTPKVDLQATIGDPALQAQLDADIKEEAKKIEDDLAGFKYYPVVSLGVAYLF